MSEEVTTETAPITETAPVEPTTQETTTTETAPDWFEGFKADLNEQELKSIEKYKDGDSFKNGTFSAFSMIGKKGDIPPEDAPEEAKAEFAKKLGLENVKFADGEKVELDESFGDKKGELEEAYTGYVGGFLENLVEKFAKNPSMATVKEAAIEFAKQDAKVALEREAEQRAALVEQKKAAAGKLGISVDDMNRTIKEVIASRGWDAGVTFDEVLCTLARETTNSNTLKDAHLNNTTEGLQAQIDELNVTLADRSVPDAKHKLNVEKMNDLLKKQYELQNKG